MSEGELPPGTTVGQYVIEKRIGAGGMGEVYQALHTGLNKRVAIKTLRSEHAHNEVVLGRFLREGQVASRIRHPNVVDITDVGVIGDTPCMVMEYMQGESLGDLLKREKKLRVSELVDWMLPVIAAVHAAHQQGVVHRDIKPANIFLAKAWSGEVTPKVLDFGISKVLEDPAEVTRSSGSSFLGSPHYASPELARGDQDLDAKSDQYALGVVLYEAATGARPFADKATSFMALMYAIAGGHFPPPTDHDPDLPPGFEVAVLRAMATRKEDRFPSVRELGAALLSFASPRALLLWEPVFGGANRSITNETGPASAEIAAPAAPGRSWGSRILGFVISFAIGAALSWGALRLYAVSKGVEDPLAAPKPSVESAESN
ncbi:MAG: serine/threonine-protein kinase [Polyangiaceae bacterium]